MLHAHEPSRRSSSPLQSQLSSYGDLTPAELRVIQNCTDNLPQNVPQDGVVLLNGSVRLLATGIVGWAKMLPDGRRQIVELSIAGDVLDLRLLPGAVPIALTKVKTWDARPLLDGLRAPEHRELRNACAQAHGARTRRLIEHITRLGRLSAFERVACLLLDLFERHQRAGLASDGRVPWTLTQEVLADVLGLSIVHLNRTLQAIRRSELVVLGGGRLQVPNFRRLAEAACRELPQSSPGFDETGQANDELPDGAMLVRVH